MINVLLNSGEKCCGCSHNIHLYIIIAGTICLIVIFILVYMYACQKLQYKHEQTILQCSEDKKKDTCEKDLQP